MLATFMTLYSLVVAVLRALGDKYGDARLTAGLVGVPLLYQAVGSSWDFNIYIFYTAYLN